jgi:multidrug efflux pump subunit AcrA (membrane-fusion protein)
MYSRARAVLAWLAGQVPTVVVLVALVALGAWGAANEWKLPESLRAKKEEEDPPKKDDEDGTSPGPVVLASDDSAGLAGVTVGSSRQQIVSQEVEAPAVLAFHPNLYARLAPRAAGAAWRVLKVPGDKVAKGDVLALFSSPDAGKVRADFITAHVQHEIKADILARAEAASSALPERQIREARLQLREAHTRLLNDLHALANLGLVIRRDDLRGLSDDEITRRVRLLGLPADVAKEPDLPANLLPLVAPFDGVVLRTDLVRGEMADPAKTCFVVADTSRLRLHLDVRQEDVARLRPGQEVVFKARATDQTATATLGWISPEVDPKTRTVLVRADIYNGDGQLRPGTFGRALIPVLKKETVTVPSSAMQWDGQCFRVFVRRDARTFEPVLVLPGVRQGDRTQVLDPRPVQYAGLAGWLAAPAGPWQALAAWRAGDSILVPLEPGTNVAAAGSHVIKSEMLKSRIGGEE